MRRTARVAAVVLLLALLSVPATTIPLSLATPAGSAGSAVTSTEPSSNPSLVPAGDGWVVESGGYTGPRGAGTTFVTCIPATELATPYELRDRWRQIEVPPLISYNADEGQPCPAGRLLEEVR